MNSGKSLTELFHKHAKNVFIKTPKESLTYISFFKSISSESYPVIDSDNTLTTLQKIFSSLVHSKSIYLLHSFWTDEQKRKAMELAISVPNREACIGVFTSGTSGLPKLALLPISSLLSNAQSANLNVPFVPNDKWLLNLPLFHVGGLGIIFRALQEGGTVLIDHDLSHATHVSMVPTQLYRFLSNRPTTPQLKALLLGGGHCHDSLIKQALHVGVPLVRSYGMTETASQICATSLMAESSQLLTSGQPLKGNSIRFETQTQQIFVTSHSMMIGYWDGHELSLPLSKQGEFITNDYGHMTEKGLVIDGRLDRIFKCGGENIQPEQIERILLTHPKVQQAYVLQEADMEYGFVPVAYIQTDESPLSERQRIEITEHLHHYLRGFFKPKHIRDITLHPQTINLKSLL